MTTYERQNFLMDLLRRQLTARVPEIVISLTVYEGTVQNENNVLETEGSL